MSRRTAIQSAILAVIVGALGPAAISADALHPYQKAQIHPYESPANVCVEVKYRDDVPGVMFTALREEASRIWLRHGIELRWNRTRETCDARVPLVFSEHDVKRLGEPEPGNVLALTHFAVAGDTIYVSASSAARLARLALKDAVTAAFRQTRTGRLLGRVVAHELGHFLLRSTMHTPTGLMRRIYGLSDVTSDDERMTELSEDQTLRLATRFSLVPLVPPPPSAVAVASPSVLPLLPFPPR